MQQLVSASSVSSERKSATWTSTFWRACFSRSETVRRSRPRYVVSRSLTPFYLAASRVDARLKGKDVRAEVLDGLAHVDPLVRFNGNGRPAEGDLSQALARLRIVIEIPGDIDSIERDDSDLARDWRLATRRAFTEALKAGFIVKEFCRSVRGHQGPGAYLLER